MTDKTDTDSRYLEARKVTLIGSVVDLLLGLLKILIGIVDESQALIADGIHSLSDLATDIIVIVAMKQGSLAADDEHPYGHRRIETLAALGLGLVLIVVAVGISQEAIISIIDPGLAMVPGWYALVVAIISLVSKEAIYRYTMAAAIKLDSELLKANAWHSRTDAISSLIVIVGIGGSMAGMPYMDAIAAVGVAIVVAKIGWDLSRASVRELIDTGLDPEYVEQLRATIDGTDGVAGVHMLRTRKMGGSVLIDVHIIVDPMVIVSEGHWIGEEVRALVGARFPEAQDITIHIDQEDDEIILPTTRLPRREVVLKLLKQSWAGFDEAAKVVRVNLHYLNDSIQLEIVLPLEAATSPDDSRRLVEKFSTLSASAVPEINEVKVLFTS
jgi:cation diffusion facilitator family transporter